MAELPQTPFKPSDLPAITAAHEEQAKLAKQLALAKTKPYRVAAMIGAGAATLCIEAGIWLSPAPLFTRLLIQGILAAVLAVGAIVWAGMA